MTGTAYEIGGIMELRPIGIIHTPYKTMDGLKMQQKVTRWMEIPIERI
jgi:hypothetical protein